MTRGFNLEILDGNWAIAAFALVIICAIYLMHEVIARRVFSTDWRAGLTTGMRVALALFTLSLGIFIRLAEIWRWRAFGAHIEDLNQSLLLWGGIIAIIGSLCAIRELSFRLFGRGPWVSTLILMVIFSAISLVFHFR